MTGDGFWYDRDGTGEKNVFQGSYEFRLPVNLANGIWRIYDTPGWGGITRTRHLLVPRATYFYRPEPGSARDDLLSFADRVGDESESVRLEVGNIVEGKYESGRKFRFLYFNMFADYNLLAEELPWSNIHGDIRANSTRDVYLNSRVSYNTYIDRFESLNADIGLSRLGWDFEVGCRIYEPGGEKHTLDLVSRARGGIGENWGIDLQARYDYNESEFKAVRAGVTRDLHCWEMQIFWEKEREETRVMVGFRIKGVPGASLRSPY